MAFKKGDLADIFRKRRRGLIPGESFPVELEHQHPFSGARLVYAKTGQKPRPVAGPYIVGWVPPGEQMMWFYRNFQTQQESIMFFMNQKVSGPPDHDDFKHDDQVNDVYGWEDAFRLKTKELALPQMNNVIRKLSDIFNIEAPGVTYKPGKKKKTYAEASLQHNEIIMYRPHLALLLHEFAHLVNDQVNQDKWAWHGPGFVRTYLSILALFPAIGNFEGAAIKAGLKIANGTDVPASEHLQAWIDRDHAGKTPNLMPSAA